MKMIKVVDYRRPFTGKDGKVRPSVNFYVESQMGEKVVRLAIRPSFSRDYALFDAISNIEIRKSDGSVDNSVVSDEQLKEVR